MRNVGSDRVEIEAEGEAAEVEAFIDDVLAHPPPSARIDEVSVDALTPTGEAYFSVAPTIGRWNG